VSDYTARPVTHFWRDVENERDLQRRTWGTRHDDTHTVNDWTAILTHQVGKFAATGLAENVHMVNGAPELQERLITIAAVCEAAWEMLERATERYARPRDAEATS
jgi:hypothetical protein